MQLRDKIAALAVLAVIAVGYCVPAKADGLPKSGLLPIGEAVKANSWTGFGVGIYGSGINADTDTTPSIGLTGQSAGGMLSASAQMGSFVLEGFGTYGWMFGDLKDLGVDAEMSVGARACVLANQQTAFCAMGAKAWLDTEAGMINGWQLGGGVKFRFQNTPTELALEYVHSTYDTAGILGVDTTSDAIRAVLTYRFGTK